MLNLQEVWTTKTEDGLFIFSTIKAARDSWILSYSKIGKAITFLNKDQLDIATVVFVDDIRVGKISRNMIRIKPEHL
jgi:hypothetical protein